MLARYVYFYWGGIIRSSDLHDAFSFCVFSDSTILVLSLRTFGVGMSQHLVSPLDQGDFAKPEE